MVLFHRQFQQKKKKIQRILKHASSIFLLDTKYSRNAKGFFHINLIFILIYIRIGAGELQGIKWDGGLSVLNLA